MTEKKEVPCIRKDRGQSTLWVDGKPFRILGGEVHNSSSSSLDYMDENVWPYLGGLGMNTVFVPVMWNLFEPVQGDFDFSLAEGVIQQARKAGMRLVFLWFGLWKNGESDYVPDWVKKDVKTYFRAADQWGIPLNCISPFCREAVLADAKAFTSFMSFLKEFDEEKQTVIMVQVENEVGLMGAVRDFGPAAEEVFCGEIPPLLKEEEKSGNWVECFGDDAEETMMAWAFASAVEQIAKAGQEIYSLPMYTNVWLEQYPWRPGTYPSGGAIGRMLSVWKKAAPSLATVSPDIYLRDMESHMREYADEGNPLLIAEARRDVMTSSYALYAMMGMHALGYAPFGIEDIGRSGRNQKNNVGGNQEKLSRETLEALQISSSAYDPAETAGFLKASYNLIQRLSEPYYRLRGTESLQCFIKPVGGGLGCLLKFRQFDFLITFEEDYTYLPVSCGGIMELEQDTFLVFGCRFRLKVLPKPAARKRAGILSLEEGIWSDGGWISSYTRNGDEKYCCSLGEMPMMVRLRAYCF